MKKISTLILMAAFAIGFANAQAPLIFSEYIEGSSNNKALEIHNPTDTSVHLKYYEIAQASNGKGWVYYHSFPTDAVLDPGGVWVIITDQTSDDLFHAENADEVLGYPSVVHHNGNDARGLVYITPDDTTLIDVIGLPDDDSKWDVAGVAEATAEHTLVRKNHIVAGNIDWAASAGTDAKDSEWIVYDQNFFDSLGVHTFIPIVDVNAINLTGAGDAVIIDTDKGTLQISAEILPANASDKEIVWSVNDITLASVNQDGLVTAINDGVVTITATAQDGSGVTATITVTGAGGDTAINENGGTLQMEAAVLPVDASDMTYTWSVNDTDLATIDASGLLSAVGIGTVTVTATANDGFGGMGSMDVEISNQYTEVANLTDLKALDPSDKKTVYKIMGEVLVTYTQSYRNKKYVQDDAGGVEIDDNPGNLTTAYNVGDGITGLMGTIQEYNGQLQFNPVADAGDATSDDNDLVPVVVTPAELIADIDMYESRLVSLQSVTFPDADGTITFENGESYDLADATDTLTCRVNFYSTSLSGTVVPDSAHVAGIVLEYKGSVQVSPRSADDVEELIYYMPSDDASITDLLVDDVSVPGFSPALLTYNMELSQGTTDAPAVTVTTTNDSAKVEVTDATDLFGTEAERTTTVVITSEDMSASKTYSITFTVDNTGISDARAVSMEVYPVPAQESLQIRSTEALNQLSVINITGSTVKVRELSGEKSVQLDISAMESGVYFLKLSGETSTSILRFVKN